MIFQLYGSVIMFIIHDFNVHDLLQELLIQNRHFVLFKAFSFWLIQRATVQFIPYLQ